MAAEFNNINTNLSTFIKETTENIENKQKIFREFGTDKYKHLPFLPQEIIDKIFEYDTEYIQLPQCIIIGKLFNNKIKTEKEIDYIIKNTAILFVTICNAIRINIRILNFDLIEYTMLSKLKFNKKLWIHYLTYIHNGSRINIEFRINSLVSFINNTQNKEDFIKYFNDLNEIIFEIFKFRGGTIDSNINFEPFLQQISVLYDELKIKKKNILHNVNIVRFDIDDIKPK